MFEEMLSLFEAPNSYFARTQSQKKLCRYLASEKNFITLKPKTKSTYILSEKGKQQLQFYSNDSMLPENNISDYSAYLKSIRKEFTSLRTSFRPFVKIKEIRKRLVSNSNLIPFNIFDKALLSLHNRGEITMEVGFTKSEVDYGIEAKNGKVYNYIIDVL